MRVVAALLVVVATGCVPEVIPPPPADAGAPADLRCLRLPETIDFGEVEPTGGSATFFLFNDTPSLKRVSLEPLEPPFFASHVGPFNVNIGASAGVVFAFRPDDPRLHLGEALFTGGEGCPTQVIALRGLGTGALTVDEKLVEFGKVPLRERRSRTITLRNTRRVALDVELMVTSPGVHPVDPVRVPALGTAQVTLVAEPTEISLLDGSVILRSRDEQQRVHDVITIGVTGRGGAPKLRLSPATLSFGHAPPGMTLRRTLQVINDGDIEAHLGPLLLTLEPGDPGELQVLVPMPTDELFPQEKFELELVLTPRTPLGARAWTLQVLSDDEAGPAVLAVTANVEAIAPCTERLVPNPTSIRVPNVAFPFSAPISFSNSTDADCLIDGLELDPPGWSLLGEARQLLVPARGSAAVDFVAPSSGAGVLRFQTWGWPVDTMPISLGF
ncbi:MAG: hypothetical protein QM817_23840 [Archangium sp.]